MNDFADIEQRICPICGVKHSHNTGVLLNKILRPIKDNETVTGLLLCEEHDKLNKDGYICLIETSNQPVEGNTLRFDEAERTGNVAHMTRKAFGMLFDTETSADVPYVFIDIEVFNRIKELVESMNNE